MHIFQFPIKLSVRSAEATQIHTNSSQVPWQHTIHTIRYYSCCVNQLWTCSTLVSSTRPTHLSTIYDVTVINGLGLVHETSSTQEDMKQSSAVWSNFQTHRSSLHYSLSLMTSMSLATVSKVCTYVWVPLCQRTVYTCTSAQQVSGLRQVTWIQYVLWLILKLNS